MHVSSRTPGEVAFEKYLDFHHIAFEFENFDPYVEVPRVIVWHNAVARIPFPTNLFCGDYDSHSGVVRHEDGSVFQEVTFEGSAVPDRLKLLKPHQP